ncbi:MAG: alpha/beta fold hydrolase [Vicinamibacteria bacterium]
MMFSTLTLLVALALETRTGLIEVPHGRIAYEEAGSGPPLILLHDGLLPGATWDAQMEPLAKHFRVIRYDRRRYGKSTSESDAFSDVDDLEALFVALKIERAALVGCSSGGGLAIDFTLAHKERVDALVLEGAVVTGFGYSQQFNERGFRNSAPLFLKNDKDAAVANWSRDRYLTDERNTTARARLAELLKLYPLVAAGGSSGARPERPALGRLNEIKVPTLVMIGESDAPDVHAHAGAITAAVSGSERQVIPMAGHLTHLERPEDFNRRLLDFLAPPTYVEEVRKRFGDSAPDLAAFAYDTAAPLEVGIGPEEQRGTTRIIDISYASPRGGRVPAYLVLPEASAVKAPGLLFLHHGQGDRKTFLDEAVALAEKGYVSLLIDAPENRKENEARTDILYDVANDRRFIEQDVIDLRRGLDVLASRAEVDANRLGYVGYSLGATMGARLLGVEPRIRASIQIVGFPALTFAFGEELRQAGTFFRTIVSDEAKRAAYLSGIAPLDGLRFLARRTPTPMLIQEARNDQFLTPLDGALFLAAAGKTATLSTFPGGHFALGDGAPREERLAFLLKTLPSTAK